jgi:dTDP-4-amino-4,6-dideoxy-D-glucose acyltransferase
MFLSASEIRKIGFKRVGEDLLIDSSVVFFHPENISIGSRVRIDGHVMMTARTSIEIGDHVHVSWGCLIYGSSPIVLEDFCGLAPRVAILGSGDDYVSGALTNPTVDDDLRNEKFGPVRLGRHVVVGTGSIILPNVTIGTGASVGALSLVQTSLPDFTVSSGNPAKPILPRDREQLLRNEAEMLRRDAERHQVSRRGPAPVLRGPGTVSDDPPAVM